MIPDVLLVQLVAAGDHDAFRLLVERYTGVVWAMAWRMTADWHDTEDVVQDTFFFLWRDARKFRGGSDLQTWLLKITINATIKMFQKRDRQRFPRLVVDVPSPEPDPERRFYDTELQQHVVREMRKLTLLERMSFGLRYFKEMPVREISARLRIDGNAVRQRIHHAVKKLRTALEPFFRRDDDARNGRSDH